MDIKYKGTAPDLGASETTSSPVDISGALSEAKLALTALRNSNGYKNAKLQNSASVFPTTWIGQCETHLQTVIRKLGG